MNKVLPSSAIKMSLLDVQDLTAVHEDPEAAARLPSFTGTQLASIKVWLNNCNAMPLDVVYTPTLQNTTIECAPRKTEESSAKH